MSAHTPVSEQTSNFVVFRLQPVYFYLLYKSICCGYSFELPWHVKAIQMSTSNICFYKENQENIALASFMKSSADLSLKCVFIRWMFYYNFFQ